MPEFHLPESLDGLTSEDLQGLHDEAVAEFNTLNESDDLSNETLDRMGVLTEAVEALRAQMTTLADNATRLASMRGRVTASVETPPPPEPEPTPEPEAIEPVEVPETVVAAAPPEVVPPARPALPATVPSTQVPEATRPMLVITAAAEIPQVMSGSQLDVDSLARAMHLKALTFKSDHSPYAPIATIEKTFEPGYDVSDLSGLTKAQTWEAIMDLSGPPALVASGGWCAPSEQMYGFFDIECARGSVLSLPSFRANRGGVTWPVSSPLPAVNSVDFVHTEDDDIAGYEKPCIVIPCPTWDECRLGAHGVCVTAGNLMDRAFPENIRRYLNQVFIAHERDENLRKIAILVAGSVAKTIPASFAAASSLINAISLEAAGYRDKYRMCDGSMLEAVFPLWVRDAIRVDIARQDDTLSGEGHLPSNADIDGWFSAAGISAQFVNDWQALTGAELDWPATVDFLMYAPGTWVMFDGGTLDLGVVRDSVLNATNDFTAAFTEDFWCIGMKGYESRIVTVPICPSGEIGDRAPMDCSVS